MGVTFDSVLFRSPDPERAGAFWGDILTRSVVEEGDEWHLPGSDGQIGLRFAPGGRHDDLRNRLHLHLSQAKRDQHGTIATCVGAGGRLQGNGHVPPNSYAVMADPVDDEFCVIEDGNAYLSGCGPLGEVTCEGTRDVGRFWSLALGWPMVWEEGEETAIQSPTGGTKLAWSGDNINPARDNTRQRFILSVDRTELDAELHRLATLGATNAIRVPFGAVLCDPDGIGFEVRVLTVR
ncbi:VOC family protein [Microbacterium sp. P01]|uniref:VOC family protein n=1 Tax=Microbacterium sp. P01 TaxID=3366261 RepID=UPI003671A908